MKQLYLLLFLILPFFPIKAATIEPAKPSAVVLTKFASLSMKQVQQLAGRKLKLKEKVAIKLAQWKIKKEIRRIEKGGTQKSRTALLFAILAIPVIMVPVIGLLFSLGFIILALVMGYSARKEDPNDKKAKAAIVLGWISLAVLIVITSIVIAILSSFSMGFG